MVTRVRAPSRRRAASAVRRARATARLLGTAAAATRAAPPARWALAAIVVAQGGQGSRAVRVRHVREAGGAVGGQRPTAPEPVTGGAPRGGRDGGRREPTAAEPGRKRVRVDRGRCGCAAMEGRHGASRTADTRATVVGTQGGQPVPGAPTRDGAHPPLSRRRHGFEEGSRVGLQMARHEALAALVEDADVHHTGVQGAAAVQGVRGGGKSPCGLLLVPHRVLPTLSRPRWSAGEGASISIKGLEPTAYSLRFASASGSGSAPGVRVSAGKSRHSGEGCKSQTVKV